MPPYLTDAAYTLAAWLHLASMWCLIAALTIGDQ